MHLRAQIYIFYQYPIASNFFSPHDIGFLILIVFHTIACHTIHNKATDIASFAIAWRATIHCCNAIVPEPVRLHDRLTYNTEHFDARGDIGGFEWCMLSYCPMFHTVEPCLTTTQDIKYHLNLDNLLGDQKLHVHTNAVLFQNCRI